MKTERAPIVLFEDHDCVRLGPLILLRPVFDLVVGARTLRARIEAHAGRPVTAARLRSCVRPLLDPRDLQDARLIFGETSETESCGCDIGDERVEVDDGRIEKSRRESTFSGKEPARKGVPGGETRASGAKPRGRLAPLFVNAALFADADVWGVIEDLGEGEGLRTGAGDPIALRTSQVGSLSAIANSDEEATRKISFREYRAARLLRHVWELIAWHGEALAADLCDLKSSGRAGAEPQKGIFTPGSALHVSEDAALEGPTVLDSRKGPIFVGARARIGPFAQIEGPAWIDHDARILGGRVANSYIGPGCRVRGEVESSVFLGWSNKAHEGFVGHSYVAKWVNLGAGTTTSDLKNSYGVVRVWEDRSFVETGMTKLGSMIGDHAKTAIATLLPTGSVVGVGAHVFGAPGFSPRQIPSFTWGVGPDASGSDFDRFLETAARVLARRDRELTAGERAALRSAFEETRGERIMWLAERGR